VNYFVVAAFVLPVDEGLYAPDGCCSRGSSAYFVKTSQMCHSSFISVCSDCMFIVYTRDLKQKKGMTGYASLCPLSLCRLSRFIV
jgi:hypothetical protein